MLLSLPVPLYASLCACPYAFVYLPDPLYDSGRIPVDLLMFLPATLTGSVSASLYLPLSSYARLRLYICFSVFFSPLSVCMYVGLSVFRKFASVGRFLSPSVSLSAFLSLRFSACLSSFRCTTFRCVFVNVPVYVCASACLHLCMSVSICACSSHCLYRNWRHRLM